MVGGIVVVPVVLGFALLSHVLGATGAALLFAPRLGFLTGARIWLPYAPSSLSSPPEHSYLVLRSTQSRESVIDLERINALNETICRFAIENRIEHPTISIDRVVDYLNPETLKVVGFERLHQVIDLVTRFGWAEYGIFATPRDVAMRLVSDSDIVILSDPVRERQAPYPMNTKIREYWDDMWNWATQHLVRYYSTEIHGIPHYVFVRPTVTINGLSGDWITSAGIIVDTKANYLLRFPFIVLEGARLLRLARRRAETQRRRR